MRLGKIFIRRHIVITLCAIAMMLVMMTGTVLAATNVVDETNADWGFAGEGGTGSGNFVNGPDSPPLGTGSAQFILDTTGSGLILGTQIFAGTALDDLTTLEYSTYNSVGNNLVAPALQINIDYDLTDSTTTWQGRLVFEPYFDNTVIDGTWQTWDALAGRWWMTGTPIVGDSVAAQQCPDTTPCDLATLLGFYPDAGVQVGALSGVLFKAGSGWLAGYQGNVDAFTIGVSGADTTFDFETINCAGSLVCYVDAATGNDSNSGSSPSDALATIQEGIDQVASGGTVYVAAGTYPESLDINKALTLSGAGQSDVTIDASSSSDYNIDVTSSDVTLEGFTLTGNSGISGTYGIKIAGPSPTRISNITVQDVTVNHSRRTGVDLNGVDGALIAGVTVNDVPSGNGFALTDSNDVVASDLTTSNNAWGGFAIYTYGRYFSLGSDNITISGTNSFGEFNKVYVERGNYNAPGSPEPVTNLTVNGFDYTVMNDTHRPSGENFTYYQITQADAIAFALALSTPGDSYVNEIATGDFWVGQDLVDTMTLQAAIQHAGGGDTIHVLDGTYPEINPLVIDKDLIIVGETEAGTIIQPTANTGNSGDARGWWLVEAGNTLNLSNMTLDGNGYLVWQAIRHLGGGSIDHVTFTDIRYNESGPSYAGTGVAIFGNSTVNVTNSTFSQIGRIGIQFFGSGVSGSTASNNTYIGKGVGDWLDYGIEVGAGAQVAITGNHISGNRGVASSDGSTSAGILVSTYFGPGTEATITDNILTDNTLGIAVGYDGSDTSVVIAHNNDIAGNDDGVNSTAPLVNAALNFWGDPSGPSGEGPGTGDSVSTNVDFCPWLTDSITGTPVASGGAVAHNIDTDEYFCTIQEAIDDSDTDNGDVIEIVAGIFTENIQLNKAVDLIGQGSGTDSNTNTIIRKFTNDAVMTITASGTGIDSIVLQDLRIEPVNVYGIDIPASNSVEYLRLDNVHVVGSNPDADFEAEVGLKVSTAASLRHLEIVDSAFDNLVYGWYFAKHDNWGPGGSNVQFVEVTNTSFSNNQAKGIYVEKLSDATFTGVTVNNNGLDTTFYNARWNAGFDINLKGEEGYANITITSSTFTNNGLGVQDGAALMIKGRDDGGTYGAHPATLDGVIVTNNTFDGNERGVRLGEPNQNNSTPTNVVVNNNNFTNNIQTYGGANGTAYGAVINHTQARVDGTVNWWDDASGPSGIGSGTGEAAFGDVMYCPWLDAPAPGGSIASFSGGYATTSTDGHTAKYCTIEEAMFASSGANQEVHVTEGNWAEETMTRDYSDSPDLLVVATGDRTNTVVNGVTLGGANFDGLTFENFTFTGDHSAGYSNYNVVVDTNGTYADLEFVDNIFDGENVTDRGALFVNRGFDGLTLSGNTFTNFENSLARPDSGVTNYSLVFLEAQGNSTGNNLSITGNTVEDVRHLNSFEAYRWMNVDISDNDINGVHGRILVWNDGSNTDMGNIVVNHNVMTLTSGTGDYSTTGIGIYYMVADVDVTNNDVDMAATCLATIGITDLSITGNTFSNCETRGHIFDEPGGGIEAISAVIQGNTFDTSPIGVENASDDFLLNACDNIFIAIGERRFENPGPFAPCNGSLTIVKEAAPNAAGVDFDFELYDDDNAATYDTFTLNGSNNGTDNVEVFESLLEGNYTVSETDSPNNWDFVSLTCYGVDYEADGASASFFISFEDEITCVFRNERRVQIRVTKFNDLNENGVRNGGENRLPGWTFNVYAGSQAVGDPIRTGVTNSNGRRTFGNLLPGTYTICEILQEGWTNITPLCQTVEVVSGPRVELGFGNIELPHLADVTLVKTLDWNGNDVNNAVNFELCLGDLCGIANYANGYMVVLHDVPVGNYTLSETPAANWTVSFPGGTTANVTEQGENTFYIHNRADAPPPPPTEQVGTIRVTKNFVTPPAQYGDFTICIQNAVFPTDQQNQPACYNVHNNGDQVWWNVVIPQNQNSVSVTIVENNPGANWSVDGSGVSVNVYPDQTSYHTITNTYNTPPPPSCDGATGPQSDLIGWIQVNGGEAIGYVQNVGNTVNCVYPIGLASYNMYDDNIDNQVIFSSSVDGARSIQPGETVELRIALPTCAAQIDLFYGDLISPMFNGNRYGSRLLAFAYSNQGNYCQVPVVEIQPEVTEQPIVAPETETPEGTGE